MKTLYNKKWYTPREIAKLGMIKNSTGGDKLNSNHMFILKLIHSGRLRAKNYSSGTKRPFWLVPEDEIERYHKELTNV